MANVRPPRPARPRVGQEPDVPSHPDRVRKNYDEAGNPTDDPSEARPEPNGAAERAKTRSDERVKKPAASEE